MKTRIWPVLMLIAALAVWLAACGSAAPANTSPTQQPSAATLAVQETSYPAPFQQDIPSVQNSYPAPAISAPTQGTYPGPQLGGAPGSSAYPAPGQGEVVEWSQAQTMILNGEVAGVVQTHSLQVTLTLKDGRTVITTEPAIDEVFKVLDQCGDKCKDVTRATE